MTPEQQQAQDQALEHVDEGRRGFLRQLLTAGAAVAAVPMMTEVALAQPPAGGKGGKGKGGKGDRPDPAEMAKMMIKKFDKNGDNALDADELTAALKELMSRRGGKGGGKGKGGKGKGKGDG